MAAVDSLEAPLTAVTRVNTWRLVQRDDDGHVLWVAPDVHEDKRLADRAARGLNERRPNPHQWWVAVPEGRPT
jgi:hypothetical protein